MERILVSDKCDDNRKVESNSAAGKGGIEFRVGDGRRGQPLCYSLEMAIHQL